MSGKGVKKVEKWLNRAFYDLEAPFMCPFFDASEKIQHIRVYKNPLSSWQLTQVLVNHQFVVLETDSWYWSIEKQSKGIVIQRSKELSKVRDYVEQKPRITPVVLMSDDEATKSTKDLPDFIRSEGELKKTYHWIGDNCQAFAKRVFDEFAKTKNHGSVLGGYEK